MQWKGRPWKGRRLQTNKTELLVVTGFLHLTISNHLAGLQCGINRLLPGQSGSQLLANGGTDGLELRNRSELYANIGALWQG
jgi:hypothetical protein